jgi:RHS repeat-associated protein
VTAPDEGINGASWFVHQLPYIASATATSVSIIRSINHALWFDLVGSNYVNRFFGYETLVNDAVNKQLILTTPAGEITKFFGFDATIPTAQRGLFKSFTDAFGHEVIPDYGPVALTTKTTLGTPRNNFNGWVGFKFTVGPGGLKVKELGRWISNGNVSNHTVKIVTSAGTDVPGASVTVATAGAPTGQYKYSVLPSVVSLAPNTAYYLVSQETMGGDSWFDWNTLLNSSSAVSVDNAVWAMNNSQTYNNVGSVGQTYGPVSLRYGSGTGSVPLVGGIEQSGGGKTAGYFYDYYTTGLNSDRLLFVTYRTNGDNLRRAKYDYYDGTDGFGSVGDLKRVTVQELVNGQWSSTPISVSYYRYYKAGDAGGFAHALKYVLSPLGYSRMLAAGITPEISTDAQLSGYAQHNFTYNSNSADQYYKSAVGEKVNGGGRVFGFNKNAPSGFANGYNNWKWKTVEELPDGNQNIVYTNYTGNPILKVFLATQSGEKWYDYFKYDSSGRVILRAESSAVASYTESAAGLVTLKSNSGLIHAYQFYSATPPIGGAPNYLQAEMIQQGSAGVPIKIREWQYGNRSVGGTTVYPVSKEIAYQSDLGGGSVPAETSFAYTWQGNFQIAQRTITLPVVSTNQNGSGIANTRIEECDSYGRVIWRRDEAGYITGYSYDPISGSLIQLIEDASLGTPWTPVPGPHLNLTTDYKTDDSGRVIQELGPTHSINIGGVSTLVRRGKWTVYLDQSFESREAVGYVKVSDGSITILNPVSIIMRDAGGRILNEIQSVASVTNRAPLATDTYPQTSWTRWTANDYTNSVGLAAQRVYHLIPDSGIGSVGVNYNQTSFWYDIMKRLVEQKSPGGTITASVYNSRSLLVESWVGTNATGGNPLDPSGGGAPGNNMVKVASYEYDGNASGGDGNLTKKVLFDSPSSSRQTIYDYDWRNRLISEDGEIDFYEETAYDNQDRKIQTDRKDTTNAGALLERSIFKHDGLGQLYQTIRYGVSGGVLGNSLVKKEWYDARGRVIKRVDINSQAFEKMTYDQIGRLIKTFLSFNINEADTDYAAASSVNNNTVLWQAEAAYDEAGNVIQTTTRDRFHNASGLGELTSPGGAQPKARVSYATAYHDGIGRPQAAVQYGTNGGAAFVRPTVIPTRSETTLVVSSKYNDRGEIEEITDPQGTVKRSSYDDAGRIVKLIENVVSGGTAPDQNRETFYTYGLTGQVASVSTKNISTGDQVTQYVYGTSLGDSDVASSDLLKTVIYPGDTITAPDRVTMAYNRLTQIKSKQDQLGTVHSYDYDKLGRLLHDRVTTLGANVDGGIRRISYAYEKRGMIERLTSYDSATVGTGVVVNENLYVYSGFGLLTAEYQSHNGAVNTSTCPKVQYSYTNGTNNHTRLVTLTYPNGRTVETQYGIAGDAYDVINRASALLDSGGQTLAQYQYLGTDRTVIAGYSSQPAVELTYYTNGGSGDAGDQYTGLDRFGRVIDQRWRKISDNTDRERVKYGFNRAGNRQWRQNAMVASGQDEYYVYDGLYQLKNLQRGTLNGSKTGITPVSTWEENFTFDPTGNWNNYLTKVLGNVSLNQNRTHNPVNEILTLAGSNSTIAHNGAGNITKAPKVTDWVSAFDLSYDAWYRLVKVQSSGIVVAVYAYDGQNRRTTKTSGGAIRHFFYSNQWQVLEERVDANTTADRQFVWGVRYIDDLILRDRGSERLYVLHDFYSCSAVLSTSGEVLERYGYDSFGGVRYMTPTFGARTASLFDWETLYGAYRIDQETSFYCVRFRYYHSALGRWLTRDVLGQIAGVNLYAYVENSPVNAVDFYGLIGIKSPSLKTKLKASLFGFGFDISLDISGSIKSTEKCCPSGKKVTDTEISLTGNISVSLSVMPYGATYKPPGYDDIEIKWWIGGASTLPLTGSISGTIGSDLCKDIDLQGKVCVKVSGGNTLSLGGQASAKVKTYLYFDLSLFVTAAYSLSAERCYICSNGNCDWGPLKLCAEASLVATLGLITQTFTWDIGRGSGCTELL